MNRRHFQDGSSAAQNLSETEQFISLFSGGAMLAFGLTRGSLLMGLVGGVLIRRGIKGQSRLYEVFGFSTHESASRSATKRRSIASPRGGEGATAPERKASSSEKVEEEEAPADPGQRIAAMGEPVPWIK